MLSGILDRMFTFWRRLYWTAVPQLPMAMVMVPDTAQETPGRTSSDFLEPLLSGQSLASGPAYTWLAGITWALSQLTVWPTRVIIPWSSRVTGKDLASGWEALERTWVAERNFKVWPHPYRDWNTRPGRNLTLELTSPERLWRAGREVCFIETPRTSFPGCPLRSAGIRTLFR